MIRNLLCAVALVALSFSLAMAKPVKGKITRIEGDKIHFQTSDNKKTGVKGEAKTYDVAPSVKVTKGKDREAVQGGLKADALSNIGKKGVGATLEVDGNKATEITPSVRKAKYFFFPPPPWGEGPAEGGGGGRGRAEN